MKEIKCRSGTVKYENRDTTPQNEQKQKYLKFIQLYFQKSQTIAISLETLNYITKNETDFKNIGAMAPAFMTAVLNNFWLQAIIELQAFYGSNNELSFQNFFNYIKANWNLIFTGEFHQITTWSDGEVEEKVIKYAKNEIFTAITNCETSIKDHKKELDKLQVFRDKVAAHYTDETKLKQEVKISINDLLSIFRITEEIINKIAVFYDRIETMLKPVNADDIRNICSIINWYIKQRDIKID